MCLMCEGKTGYCAYGFSTCAACVRASCWTCCEADLCLFASNSVCALQTYWRAARLLATSAARFFLLGSTLRGLSCGGTRATWSSLVGARFMRHLCGWEHHQLVFVWPVLTLQC